MKRREQALGLYSEGRFEEALELLSSEADSPESCLLRGELQCALGRLHEASRSYSLAAEKDPGNAYAHRRLADSLRTLKRWEGAQASYRKALALDSQSYQALVGLGDCLLHLNCPDDALACFESCPPDSEFVTACFGRAVALQMLSRWEESTALYEHVLKVRPKCEEALANLIALSVERFDLRRVEQFALELLSQDPDSLIALQALTMVSFERRNYQQASDYFFRWEANLPEGGIPPREDAIQYRLSRENVERLAELRTRQLASGSASGPDRGL